MKTLNFPNLQQTYYWDCGASAALSMLLYYGVDVRGVTIMKKAGTNSKGGTPLAGIKKVVKEYGLDFKAGKMTIEDIKGYLDKKIPVLVLVQARTKKKNVDWTKEWDGGHYAIAIGYDAKKLYFEDPSTVVRTYLTYEEFQDRWHDIDIDGKKIKKYINWGMAVFGKKPSYDPSKPKHMDFNKG